MALKIGDKVRFLNSTGGGVVKRFINKETVEVEEEDGFDTPVLIRECVIINPVSNSSKEKEKSPEAPHAPVKKIGVDSPVYSRVVETREGDVLNVYLAFLPMEPKSLSNSRFEAFIVNDSNYFLQFSYMSKQADFWKLRYAGIVEPNQKLFVEEFGKEQLNDLERITVQFVAFKQGKVFRFKFPVSVEHKIDTVKFYKLHSFCENDYFEDDAIMLPIVRNDKPERQIEVSPRELELAMLDKKSAERPRIQPIEKKSLNAILEVDLHVSELLDNTTGLSNSDIIQLQLDKFRSILAQYKNEKGKKIVFIHGKGEGVLRKAIVDELRFKYKNYQFQDASFKEYGFGATLVTIK